MQDPRKITVQGILDRSPLPGRSQSADSAGLKDSRNVAPPSSLSSSRAICVALVGASDATRVLVKSIATVQGWLLYGYPDQFDARMLASRWRPNLLLLAVSTIQRSSGLVGKLKREAPGLAVVILSQRCDPGEIASFLALGADGYIVEEPSSEYFESAIVNVAYGSGFLCRTSQEVLVRYVQSQAGCLLSMGLSAAERSIAPLLLGALGEKQIAESAAMPCATLHTHLVRLYRKLGVHSREQAVQRLFPSAPFSHRV